MRSRFQLLLSLTLREPLVNYKLHFNIFMIMCAIVRERERESKRVRVNENMPDMFTREMGARVNL